MKHITITIEGDPGTGKPLMGLAIAKILIDNGINCKFNDATSSEITTRLVKSSKPFRAIRDIQNLRVQILVDY